MRLNVAVFAVLLLSPLSFWGQTFVAGESYFGANNYIEYIAGNAPIVISAPHGGYLTPAEIPDRNCTGCSYARDLNTQEVTRALRNAIYTRTGCYPHLIINLLHRKKLDANREIIEAADSNALAEQAWYDFHGFVEAAEDSVAKYFGRGLYIDMHGHGHSIQRLELGYLLYLSELQLPDSTLALPYYSNVSSLKRLADDNLQALNLPELLRGPQSFGALMAVKNYPSVPSPQDSFPETGEPYFNGGYNTNRYTSSNNGSVLSGLQIESNYTGVRDNATNISRFADSLASSIVQFLQWHYLPQQWCAEPVSSAETDDTTDIFNISPIPSGDYVTIRFEHSAQMDWNAELMTFQGVNLGVFPLTPSASNTLQLPYPGVFMLLVRHKGQLKARRVLVRM